MPSTQIANPGGAFGLTASGTQDLIELVNNSGATRTDGDVVVIDVTGTLATTTTTANAPATVGVVSSLGSTALASTVASGKPMLVAVGGVARVNVASNTVAVGDILASSTAAGVAVVNNSATVGQAIGIALEASSAKDANNTIRALIKKM